ncbi:hypothetical protein NL676_030894 [Syzygium grande]|nr:hypothetical protein NL676_030894 [Syzygium grande]
MRAASSFRSGHSGFQPGYHEGEGFGFNFIPGGEASPNGGELRRMQASFEEARPWRASSILLRAVGVLVGGRAVRW